MHYALLLSLPFPFALSLPDPFPVAPVPITLDHRHHYAIELDRVLFWLSGLLIFSHHWFRLYITSSITSPLDFVFRFGILLFPLIPHLDFALSRTHMLHYFPYLF